MPKTRKGAGSGALFSIGPWQHKGDKPAAKGAEDNVEYTVIEEDLVPRPSVAQQGQAHAVPPAAPRPEPPPWRSAVRRPDLEAAQAALDPLTTPANAANPPALPPSTPQLRRSLTGSATLVALGESRLVGTFTLDTTGISYPLHGRHYSGYR
jgi:hypothetical protein